MDLTLAFNITREFFTSEQATMSIFISFLFGAIGGASGVLYWQKRKTSSGASVKPQGGGGPGEETK